MMNDYAWTTLNAHRESEHRARALRRGGDDTARAARRRTASDAPTAAAAAWARLASGAGSLAPADRSETGSGREAA